MATPKVSKVCAYAKCGRSVRALGLCQTHYKQRRAGKKLRPIQPKRMKRPNTMRYAGLSLTRLCARVIARRARREKCAPNAIITDVLESWAIVNQHD